MGFAPRGCHTGCHADFGALNVFLADEFRGGSKGRRVLKATPVAHLLWFEWFRNVESPDRFVPIEGFRDADAGAEHVNSEHFKEAIRLAPSMLVDTPEILYAELPGTEWSLLAEMSVPESGSA